MGVVPVTRGMREHRVSFTTSPAPGVRIHYTNEQAREKSSIGRTAVQLAQRPFLASRDPRRP